MRHTALIFLREMGVRVRDWRFWLGVLSLPLLAGIVGGIVVLVEKGRQPTKIYLVGQAQTLNLQSDRRFAFVEAPPMLLDTLLAQLNKGEGILLYEKDSTSIPRFTVYVREAFSTGELEALEQLLRVAVLSMRLRELGLSPEQTALFLAPPVINALVLSEKGEKPRAAEATALLSTVLNILLFSLIMSAGGQILLSVLEEKSNRLAEYLLIYVTPTQLLTGKLLASITAALIQALVWIGFAVGGVQVAKVAAPPLFEALAGMPWGWIGIYLVGGILLYTFLYAAAGASSDSVTELSSFAQSLQWPLLISFFIVSVASLQASPALNVFLSHFPLTSPLAMPLRLTGSAVSLPERLLSLSILWGSVLGARFLAARLYQRALLLYGQKLSWKAIWYLLRH